MYKKLLLGMVLFALLSVILAACTIRDVSLSAGPVAHMGLSNFVKPTMTIKKGDTLTLVDDAASPHIILNGYWQGSNQVKAKEPGAPDIKLNFNGNDSGSTPPFTQAGTFKIYCTIHGGMNLTITVQ
jgi:plastocyanin